MEDATWGMEAVFKNVTTNVVMMTEGSKKMQKKIGKKSFLMSRLLLPLFGELSRLPVA